MNGVYPDDKILEVQLEALYIIGVLMPTFSDADYRTIHF